MMPKRAYTRTGEFIGVYMYCRGCRQKPRNWPTYTCPRCGTFAATYYRREHRDPRKAERMTLGEIAAEYARAGMPVPPSLAAMATREMTADAA